MDARVRVAVQECKRLIDDWMCRYGREFTQPGEIGARDEIFEAIDALAALSLHVGDAADAQSDALGATPAGSGSAAYRPEPQSVSALRAPIPGAVELTDEQIDLIANDGMRNAAGGIYATRVYEFARAIERAIAPAEQPNYKALWKQAMNTLGDIQRALGISDEEAACANGSDVFVAAIEARDDGSCLSCDLNGKCTIGTHCVACSNPARGIDSGEAGETRSGSTPKGQEPGCEATRPEAHVTPGYVVTGGHFVPTTPTEGPALLTDEEIDAALSAAYSEAVARGITNGGMAGHLWDHIAARAIESKVRASTLTDPEGAS